MATINIETITPEIAKVYLGFNTKNRRKSADSIQKYLSYMRKGEWYLSNDAICFDTNRVLINGQNRLFALIEYGKPLQFLVGRDFDENSFAIMDKGKIRTTGDTFYINGVQNATCMAAVVRKHILLQKKRSILRNGSGNGNYSKADVTDNELLDIYKSNFMLYDTIITASIRIYDKTRILGQSEIAAYICHLVMDMHKDYEKTYAFFAQICSLKESPNKMLELLRTKLLKDKLSIEKSLTPSVKQALIIKVWNYYDKDKEVGYFRYDPEKDKDIWFE